jgi:autotransporter translocation and assembly factor TamB
MREGLDFRLMQGTGRCGGRVRLGVDGVELDLGGRVEGLEFPLFPGFSPELRGSWRLGGPVTDLELSGDLKVERAVLRSKQSLATVLMEWLDQPSAPSGTDILRLDLRVEADQTIQARNPLLNLTGSALLDVTGTPARPGLVGRVEFLEGGEVTFQGVRYELDRATIAFSDPDRIDPWVEMQARAWVQSYQITLTLVGTFDRLVPTLVSDPPLPEHEIVSLLAVGLRDQDAGGSALGVNLASTLLTQQINQELDRRARTLLPVDQIRLDPFTEATTGNPAARVTVVKQMSSSWTLILESNLSTNREEVILSRWQLAPQLFLEAERDVDGSYSLDLKLRKRY